MDVLGVKNVAGHVFQITMFHDQGGGLEEITLWCHTCDEDGINTWVVPVSSIEDAILATLSFRETIDQHVEAVGVK